MKKPRKSSPKQQAVINYGIAIRSLSNSYCLAQFLKKNGHSQRAHEVERAIQLAKEIAVDNYCKERLSRDPEWKPVWPELGAPTPSPLEQEARFREQASKQ